MKKKNILIGIIVLLGILQFIKIDKNIHPDAKSEFLAKYPMNESTYKIWQKACADCHSNNTVYPWYSNIQPVGFWLNSHVNEGKTKFNIDEINTKPLDKQKHKLDEMTEMINKGEMPLWSYTIVHTDAKLTDSEKTELLNWAKETMGKL